MIELKIYTAMTDEEINELVGSGLGYNSQKPLPDYCNDWAAIGPSIFDNGIELRVTWCPAGSGPVYWAIRDDDDNTYSDYQGSPQRAAAVCLLMIKEPK
tara:strand:+ start:11097 stop:11393 length:297 start_codon:yes stop_codon:yes gene_type:complete